jgi:serine protease inhibitor
MIILFILLSFLLISSPPIALHSSYMSAAPAANVAAVPVSGAVNAFAFDLLQKLAASAPNAPSFISPLSIAQALAMLLNGAPDECAAATELRRALHVDAADEAPTNVAALNAGHRRLLDALSRICGAGVELSIANSVWVRGAANAAFTAAIAAAYSATASPLTTAQAINEWCAEKTHDKIKTIVDAIHPQTLAILVNAVYFKGKWKVPFKKDASVPDQPFTSLAGTTARVTMMHQRRDDFRYAETDSYQAIELSYGTAAAAASAGAAGAAVAPAPMVAHVLLPRAGVAMADFIRGLRVDEFSVLAYGDGLSKRAGDLLLPRFKSEAAYSLNAVLAALGVRAAFDPAIPSFTKISASADPAFVSDVIHKTFVECNEEGTEAAAVTAVMMRCSAAVRPVERFMMRCDRPFVFSISAHKTLLFIGVIDVTS